jgi:hypothetical protein
MLAKGCQSLETARPRFAPAPEARYRGGKEIPPLRTDTASWTGFLLTAIGAVGLVGAVGIMGAQVPYQRALARDAALTQALLASSAPDAKARLDALRPALDDSADHILSGPGDMPVRVAAERARMLAEFDREARNVRVRMLIGLAAFTAGGGLFAALVLSIVARKEAA